MRNAVTLVWGLLRLAPMKLYILCVVMCFLVFNMSCQEFMYCYHTVKKRVLRYLFKYNTPEMLNPNDDCSHHEYRYVNYE